jgi:hypothetical protein
VTALNVIVSESAAHIVTDGVAHRPDESKVRHFTPKVATAPHLAAAVGVSGPVELVPMYADIFWGAETDLDGVMASIEESTAAAPERWVRAAAGGERGGIRIVIAGHSKRHGPAAWALEGGRFQRFGPGQRYLAPAIEGWSPFGDCDPPRFDASLVELVTRQRDAHPGQIGGFVSLTTVRPTGIEQRTAGPTTSPPTRCEPLITGGVSILLAPWLRNRAKTASFSGAKPGGEKVSVNVLRTGMLWSGESQPRQGAKSRSMPSRRPTGRPAPSASSPLSRSAMGCAVCNLLAPLRRPVGAVRLKALHHQAANGLGPVRQVELFAPPGVEHLRGLRLQPHRHQLAHLRFPSRHARRLPADGVSCLQ